MKFCLVDDSVNFLGGTSLTLDAIIEPNKGNVTFVSTMDFSLKDVFSFDFFIFGNITNLNSNSLESISHCMDEKDFCKIDFDYGYCKYRGDIPHKILGGEACNCPEKHSHLDKLYIKIKDRAKFNFFMSREQMKMHQSRLGRSNNDLVLSSCFTKETMLQFKKLKQKKKNGRYAIIDGQGGWHTQAKGIKESIAYAQNNNLSFDLIKTETYQEMLDLLSNYHGLISMPIIHDTCPRITIEARYMGLKILTNKYSQHIMEDWWKSSDEEAFLFTSGRPDFFWNTIK